MRPIRELLTEISWLSKTGPWEHTVKEGEIREFTSTRDPHDFWDKIRELALKDQADSIYFVTETGEIIGDSWWESADDDKSSFLVTDFTSAWKSRHQTAHEHAAFLLVEAIKSAKEWDTRYLFVYRISFK